ncbi:MAG: hypothetical protein ACFFBV_00040 [Promethearchaeota archaeon]
MKKFAYLRFAWHKFCSNTFRFALMAQGCGQSCSREIEQEENYISTSQLPLKGSLISEKEILDQPLLKR